MVGFCQVFRFFSLPPRGQLVILQHRQGRTLVLAIGLPRAGLDTLTKVGVRCMKEVVVVKVRAAFLGNFLT